MIRVDANHTITDARFSDILRQSIRVGECLLFQGYRIPEGYGRIEFKCQQIYVHRAAYAEHHRRPIPPGLLICHTCDTPNCIEPAHLFAGTNIDNVADMWAKGRGSKPPVHTGEENPNATLSDKQVADLRAMMAAGGTKQRDAAALFGVSQSTVWRLTHQKVRAHHD